MAVAKVSLDMPAEVLYWNLTQGQRHDLATRLGLHDDQDRVIYPDDIKRSQAWLQRARDRGSVADLILAAEALHRSSLRHLQDAIRLNGVNGTFNWDDELAEFVSRHYQWLAYASTLVAEDRRERAYRSANEKHPLPLSGVAAE